MSRLRGNVHGMNDTSRGRYLSELRRSNAAGIHSNKQARGSSKRRAIMSEMLLDDELDDDLDFPVDYVEPTPEELKEAEKLYREFLASEGPDEYVPDDVDPEAPLAENEDPFDGDYDYDGFNASNYQE